MPNEIKLYENKLKNLSEVINLTITNPKEFGDALFMSRQLKNLSDEIEKAIKERGSSIMSEEETAVIETESYKIQRMPQTETNKYLSSSVIAGLGVTRAISFLKVDGSKLKKYIKTAFIEGEELRQINLGRTEAYRKGFIKLTEKK